jgi:DNA (cytosine-5)-methyltransferase 1
MDTKNNPTFETQQGNWWEVEPDVGRVADGIPNRVDRLRGLGNAVVPQVAEYIGRLITTSLDA